MAGRDGNGNFSLTTPDFVAGTTISSSQMDTNNSDIATALTQSIAVDGQTTTTASIPFAANLKTDVIAELTAAVGVTVDGVLLKDGKADTTKGADIASATTTDIGAATGNYVDITGTVTITGLGTITAGAQRVVQFDGILTLTHSGTALILPGAANITTAAGDTAGFVSLGSGNWKCEWYTKSSGAGLVQVSLTAGVTGTLPVANGGTGASTHTANNVLVGAGASAIASIAPSTIGNVLTSNGTSWTSAAAGGGGYTSMQVFTSTGTWTRPAGVTKVMVIVTAGGGGGGGTPNDSQRGGGAGGGTAIETIDVSSTSSAAVTVGAAGTAGAADGNDGGAGGTSSFASFCSATGGAGGEGSSGDGSDIAATAGGTGSGGDINLKGGDAYYFARTAAANWGGPPTGGGSYWGPGGVGQYRGTSVGGGTTGTYGTGGGGSNTAATGGGYAGAAGGAGIVVVYEYK
jgi:hypothetical protein